MKLKKNELVHNDKVNKASSTNSQVTAYQPCLQSKSICLQQSPSQSDAIKDNVNSNQQEPENQISQTSQGGYNATNRRRMKAARPKNTKGRGGNKTKLLKDPVFVEVNEFGQPIGDEERPLSSLIGCLTRDPRKLPLDCWDWRLLSQEKKDAVWEEVKQSYKFADGLEPYDWAMKTMNAAWRLKK